VRLPEQSFQILTLLLANPGEVVTRADLRQRLWPDLTAGDFDSGLNNAIKKLRDALGDSAESPRLIETLPRRGYRFLGTVESPEAPVPDLESISAPKPENPIERDFRPTVEQSAATAPRRFPIWPAAAVLLLILVAGAAFYQRGEGTIRSVAVLPFDNLMGDASQNYFVDSISAAVTTHLSEVAGLDVISRTSAQQFKGTDKGIRDIARTLNVEGIVEGEVTRSGEHVRITVKLIHASTDRSVWSHTYDASLGHMIPLQQRIASDIAVQTGQPRPQAGARRRPRVINPQAYDAYLKALTAKGAQRVDGFQRAVTYLDEAIKIQPDFGEAYAELALVQLQFVFTGPYSPHELFPKAEAAAREALNIDETIGLAHFVLGRILTAYYWRLEDAEKEFRLAAERGRGSAPSAFFARQGRFDEALAAAERARQLDPLSVQAQLALGNAYQDAGHHDRALEELRRALAMADLPRIHFAIGQTFVAMGRFADAIPELESAMRPSSPQAAHNPRYEAFVGYAYAAAGRIKDARAVLTELEVHRRDQYVSSYGVALIHDALQETELALAALQRAYDDRALEFAQMRQYPRFKTIASEPRFKAIMQRVGLPE